jgi:PAS domain S-box-containing protein
MMARNPSSSDTAGAARTGGRRRFSLRPLRDPAISSPAPSPRVAQTVQPSSERTMAVPVGQTVGSVARLPAWLHRLGYYGLALVFVAAATLLRWAFSDVLSLTPFLVFYLALAGAAAFGGLGPGLLATLASWLCIDFLFDPTPGHIGFDNSMSVVRLLVFLAGGLVVSVVGEKMRRTRTHERRQAGRLAELARSLESEKDTLQAVMNGARNSHLVYLDRDFNFVRVNEAYARTCGYAPEEMIGKNHFALYPHAENEAIFARVRDTGESVEFHDRPFIFPDQPERGITYWDWTLTPIKNGSGYVEGLVFSLFETTERKRAEEQMRQRAEEVETLMDLVPVCIWVARDPACNHIVGNQAANRLYEAQEHENVSANVSPVRRFFRDGRELKPGELPMQEAAARDIDIRDAEVDVLLPSGTWRNVLGSASPLHDAQGRVRGCIGAFMDITIRKQTEQALRESEERYRTLFESSRDGIIFTDMEGRILRANPYYREMLGYPEEELRALTYQQLTPQRWQETEAAIVRDKIMSRGYSGEYEKEYIRKDGTVFPISIQVWLVRDAHGEPQGMWGIVRDITERKRAEELLRESEEKYRRIVEIATEGIVMVDAEARIVFVNVRWSEIFGYSAAEAGRITLFDLVFPEDMVRMRERWESRKRGQKETYESRFRRKDGRPVWILGGVAPRFDPEGRFLGTLVLTTDITERKQAEEALRELNATLESKVAQRTAELEQRARQLQRLTLELSETEERERKRLAQVLHDDLQQVLAAAKFHLSRVGSGTRGPKSSQEIVEQVQEMLKDAIEKSRDLSHELSPAVLYHGDVAETLGWLAEQMQAKHGLTVHVEVLGEVRAQSDAVKAFVYRTAQELLFNVVKHARVHEARVRIRCLGRYLCLSVSDRGRGFDPQEVKETAGFGLLSIRERVALLGGRMKAKSARGRGATFRIIVPDTEPSGTGVATK